MPVGNSSRLRNFRSYSLPFSPIFPSVSPAFFFSIRAFLLLSRTRHVETVKRRDNIRPILTFIGSEIRSVRARARTQVEEGKKKERSESFSFREYLSFYLFLSLSASRIFASFTSHHRVHSPALFIVYPHVPSSSFTFIFIHPCLFLSCPCSHAFSLSSCVLSSPSRSIYIYIIYL